MEAQCRVWALSPPSFPGTSSTEAITGPLCLPQPPGPGRARFQGSAPPRTRTPSSFFCFFCTSQGTPTHLPNRTGAARHSLQWLGHVLLPLVSSLLTHRAFQRAELSACLAIKEAVSRALSVQRGSFPSFLEDSSHGGSTRVCASGICTRMASEASETRAHTLPSPVPDPCPCLLSSLTFPTHLEASAL